MRRQDFLDKLRLQMESAPDDENFQPLAESFLIVSAMTEDEWRLSPIGEFNSAGPPRFASLPSSSTAAIGDFATGPIAGIEFRRLTNPDKRIPISPRFLFGTFPESLLNHYFSHWGITSMGIFACRDVSLVGEFLLHREDSFFRSSELNIHPAHIQQALNTYSPLASQMSLRRVSGQHVALAGPGFGVYGHWLVEYLPKLGLLHAAGYDLDALSYLMPTTVPRFVQDWLTILGIVDRQITWYDPAKEIMMAEELLLPTVPHNGVRMSPLFADAARFLKGLVAANNGGIGASGLGKRIFVSRRKSSQARQLLNRLRIEEMAVDAGFVLAYPEELTIKDQVCLFAGAEQIIGEYGSALHGSMFSEPGTVVCALRGNIPHPGFIQSGLGEIMMQPTGYVMGQTESDNPNSPFIVSEQSFGMCLKLIFSGISL